MWSNWRVLRSNSLSARPGLETQVHCGSKIDKKPWLILGEWDFLLDNGPKVAHGAVKKQMKKWNHYISRWVLILIPNVCNVLHEVVSFHIKLIPFVMIRAICFKLLILSQIMNGFLSSKFWDYWPTGWEHINTKYLLFEYIWQAKLILSTELCHIGIFSKSGIIKFPEFWEERKETRRRGSIWRKTIFAKR